MFKQKPPAYYFGLILVIFFALSALASVAYTPYDPMQMNAESKFSPPSVTHLFGTDNFGRDILSRTLVALRYSLMFSAVTLAASFLCGVTIGLLTASANRVVNMCVMRCIDALASIPAVLFSLVLLGVFADGVIPLLATMTIIFTPPFVRVARNEALRIRELDYIAHARVLGASRFRILYAHALPNMRGALASTSLIVLSNSLLVESALSYLGVGIQPPFPSLGRMLFEAQSYLFNAPWGAALPGAVMVLLVAACNFLGDGVLTSRRRMR